MKKITILTLFAAFLFAGTVANAQEKGDIRAGLGLAAGTKASADEDTGETKLGLGINVQGEYLITDALSFAPSYTIFFKTEFDGGGEIKPSVLNLDVRYYVTDSGIYVMAGAAVQKIKFTGGDNSATGLNFGAGIVKPISDSMSFNGQAKFMTADDEETFDGAQLVLNAGVVFSF